MFDSYNHTVETVNESKSPCSSLEMGIEPNRTVRLVKPNRTRTFRANVCSRFMAQCSVSVVPETLEKLMFLRYNM